MLICLIQFSMLENVKTGLRKILRIKLISCFIFRGLVVLIKNSCSLSTLLYFVKLSYKNFSFDYK